MRVQEVHCADWVVELHNWAEHCGPAVGSVWALHKQWAEMGLHKRWAVMVCIGPNEVLEWAVSKGCLGC